jgi:hypothetical protein
MPVPRRGRKGVHRFQFIRSGACNASGKQSSPGDHPIPGRGQAIAPTMDEPANPLRQHSRAMACPRPTAVAFPSRLFHSHGHAPTQSLVLALLGCQFVSPRLISRWSNELESMALWSPCAVVKRHLTNEKLPREVANNKQQSKHNQTDQ